MGVAGYGEEGRGEVLRDVLAYAQTFRIRGAEKSSLPRSHTQSL